MVKQQVRCYNNIDMEIKSIELSNFRNYNNQKIKLSPHLNIIIGNNAQGKTNILEGVFLCAIGKSPRTTKDKDMIKWNCSFGKITLEVLKSAGQKKIEMYLFANQNKAIKINGLGISKISELLGEFNAIYFSPDELKLVKDSPDERRRFMDLSISQFNKNYFHALRKYNEILAQRNKLLKTNNNEKIVAQTISIWDEQLATVGAQMIIDRIAFIDNIKKPANEAQKYLTNSKENLELEYTGMVAQDADTIKQLLLNAYHESLKKDMTLGYTTVGPHRDDIKIVVDDIDIRHFGSQGQQRTTALALKLAELEVFKQNTGEYPVLLLDDVLSELDAERQTKLLKRVSKIQTILTCTDFEFASMPCKKFYVKNGTIENVIEA